MEILAAIGICSPPPLPQQPSSKPKSRPLCSMLIFKGYGGGGERCDPELREIWRGCKGYCQRGLDICAVHAKSRMRQQRKAAIVIQSIARRNRAQKLVAGLMTMFGKGQHRDVFMLILEQVRMPLYKAAPKNCAPCALKGSC